MQAAALKPSFRLGDRCGAKALLQPKPRNFVREEGTSAAGAGTHVRRRTTIQGIVLRQRKAERQQAWGLERVVFPLAGFTLEQVVEYYDAVAPVLLPHLQDHPVTLKRYPDEAGGEYFWEKDAPGFTPGWVKTFAVWRRSGESQIHYILINDRRTLLWAASVGTLEFHPFLAKAPDIDRPTAMVFDLDPGPPADIMKCAEVALLLRELLERLGLQAWAKVSGSKGLQVYAPLNTAVTYTVTQSLARSIAEMLHREHRSLVVSEMERRQRQGKVFIDWSQNADYKTTVAVYSLRAKRRHPYISLPVSWEELKAAVGTGDPQLLLFSPEAALERLKRRGDLFAPLLTLKQHIPESFVRQFGNTVRTATAPASHARGVLQLPRVSAQGGRRRFVLSKKGSAWQLTLEMHDVIKAWELPQSLPGKVGEKVGARELPAPGSFPEVAGDVADAGTSELIEGNYAKGYLDLFFSGAKAKGEVVLRAETAPTTWSVEKTTRAGARAPQEKQAAESLPKAAPGFVKPMECKLVTKLPEGESWVYELKLDGYRVIAVKKGSMVHLLSRYGNSLTQRFAKISAALRQSGLRDAVLDGEVVALDEQGRPSFQELQNSASTHLPIVYYVFDVLNHNGRDLQALPLQQRKKLLEEIGRKFVEPMRLAATLDADLPTLLAEIRRRGLEGLVAKRKDSIYEAGKRSGSWMKHRVNQREEFVIGGYLPGRNFLDALLVGRFKDGKLYFVKKVRNGLVRRTRERVLQAIEHLRTAECPFVNLPEASDRRGAITAGEMKQYAWVKPEIKCEVDFEEWTRGGRLRHAAFRQLVWA